MSRLDRAVVAYAFLAQAQRSNNDLLSGLMPIFKPIAKLHEGEEFNPTEFANLAGELYGLSVNAWAVEGLAPRLEAAGILVKRPHTGKTHDYVYARIDEEFTEVTEKDVGSVLERFVEFARSLLEGKEDQEFSDEYLKESFLQHIVDLDFMGVLLRPVRAENSKGRAPLGLTKPTEQIEWESDKTKRAKIDVLCAAFIIDIYHKDQPLYGLVARIVAGALVSEVVLNFQDPEIDTPLTGLRVILDAPFLMDVLNLAGDDSHAVAALICAQLREHGARLAVFRHSIDEMRDNLTAVINETDIGRGFGKTARRLASGAFRAYAMSVKDAPEGRLKAEKIEIIESPKFQQAYQWFTQEDEQEFCSSLGFYGNHLAQERDAASIAGVVRLRNGHRVKMGRFHACRNLFVTTNQWVADRGQTFLKRANLYEEGDVPAALTDRNLAGLLWVLYGGKTIELPAHMLLANCAAAIEPKSDLVQRMYRFLADVDQTQADHFYALMTDERAAQYLTQLTLGDSLYVTKENFPEILETMKAALLEEYEIDRKREREEREKAHSEQREALTEEIRSARAETMMTQTAAKEAQEHASELERKLRQERDNREEQEARIIQGCIKSAQSVRERRHLLVGLFLAALGVGAAFLATKSTKPFLLFGGLLGGGLIALTSFWKMPELLFKGWINRGAERTFYQTLAERGIDSANSKIFIVDWDAGTYERKDVSTQEQQQLNS